MKRLGANAFACLLLLTVVAPAEDLDPKAAKVVGIFDQLRMAYETGEGTGQRHEITQDEFNAYLAAMIRENPDKGIEGTEVELKRNSLRANILVNMDEIPMEKGMASGFIRSLLSGRRTLQVDGDLQGREGTGNFVVREVWLGSIPLPSALANSLLKSLGEKQDPPFDPTEAFQLPYGIQSIELFPGKAILKN